MMGFCSHLDSMTCDYCRPPWRYRSTAPQVPPTVTTNCLSTWGPVPCAGLHDLDRVSGRDVYRCMRCGWEINGLQIEAIRKGVR